MSETFTILKRYRVLQGKPVTEPMDDMDEDKFYGWLRARGYSHEEAGELVQKTDADGSVQIQIPK